MIKKTAKNTRKCTKCGERIPEVAYFNTKIVCDRCFERLRTNQKTPSKKKILNWIIKDEINKKTSGRL